jgi:hypothetical protein
MNLPNDYVWQILGSLTQDLSHLLTDKEFDRITSIIRSRDFDAYLSLSQEWDLQGICLIDKNLAQFRAVYQLTSLLKKFDLPNDKVDKRSVAKEKFFATEDVCREYNQEGYTRLSWAQTDEMVNVFTYAKSFLEKLLGHTVPDSSTMTEWSRHGPGANLDTQYGLTSSYNKYHDWPYSCTSLAVPYARSVIMDDERWIGALEDDYRRRYNIPKTAILDRKVFWSNVISIVPGNRIAFVPKNALTERTIAIEPSLNLYLQLGVDGYIRRRLKRWGVDIDDQTKNQEMARIGSINQSNEDLDFVTIDLSAASDSISLKVCEKLLPTDWYNHLIKLRSPSGALDDETILYEKISSMGNGFTFALETAIFTALVYGVMMEVEGKFDKQQCAIYGDDIIVTKRISSLVIHALHCSGFAINDEKSFLEGNFKESCGSDWFHGKPVRPVFLKNHPKTIMNLWTDINRLKRILLLRFDIEESKTEQLMDKWIPDLFRKYIGPFSDEDFDSYKHTCTCPIGVRKYDVYRFRRIIVQPVEIKGHNFFFKKLMHPLRPLLPRSTQWGDSYWHGTKLTSSGSAFTITKRNFVKVRQSYSVSDVWTSTYKET